MEFKNRENEVIEKDGKQYWISRSIALVALVLVKVDKQIYVLSEKRSQSMDQPGRQCLVCGYLDWDENGWDGIRREIYEETSLNIDDLKWYSVFDNDQQPYYVKTEPGENRQNVTLNYILYYDLGETWPDFVKSIENFKCDEVDEVRWVPAEEINNYDWAFNHAHRLIQALEYLDTKI